MSASFYLVYILSSLFCHFCSFFLSFLPLSQSSLQPFPWLEIQTRIYRHNSPWTHFILISNISKTIHHSWVLYCQLFYLKREWIEPSSLLLFHFLQIHTHLCNFSVLYEFSLFSAIYLISLTLIEADSMIFRVLISFILTLFLTLCFYFVLIRALLCCSSLPNCLMRYGNLYWCYSLCKDWMRLVDLVAYAHFFSFTAALFL